MLPPTALEDSSMLSCVWSTPNCAPNGDHQGTHASHQAPNPHFQARLPDAGLEVSNNIFALIYGFLLGAANRWDNRESPEGWRRQKVLNIIFIYFLYIVLSTVS